MVTPMNLLCNLINMVMRIDELFNHALPIKWVQKTKTNDYWRGEFIANNTNYSIVFNNDGDWEINKIKANIWEVSFGPTEDVFLSSKVIGTNNNHMKIFATVIAGIRTFLQEVQPEYIMLHAVKENENRFPLYQHMANYFKKELAKLHYVEINDIPIHSWGQKLLGNDYDTLTFKKINQPL